MNIRERFKATMSADPGTDCCPVIELTAWWDKTIKYWEGEGLPEGKTQRQIFSYFSLDHYFQFMFNTRLPECPNPPYHGAPLISDERGYMALRPLILPDDAVDRILPQVYEARAVNSADSALVWYTFEGFFWFPRVLLGTEAHLYAFYDKPRLYHIICEDLLEWQIKVVEKLSLYIETDFMTFAEDMSYINGPLISEMAFDEFMAPYYQKIIPIIKGHGTRVIIDSNGDVTTCIPWFIRCGIEGALPLEKQAGVDIGLLRARYPDFLLMGGFDNTCILDGKEAIDAEFARLAPTIRKGRYIPSLDHQTPPGAPIDVYKYYVAQLRHFSGQACKDC